MPLQDLTPQLRTRLSRVERAVGLFISVATLLLVAGFVYYVYHTAQRKGWLLTKVTYYTYVRNAAGLNLDDPVKLMGFEVGRLTRVEAMPPFNTYDVYIEFQIKSPYYGYLWTDSKVKVAATDFLGHRYIEVTKGFNGKPTVKEEKGIVMLLTDAAKDKYEPLASRIGKPLEIECAESPALTERLENVATTIEKALPGILNLTNQVNAVLTNAVRLVNNLDATVTATRPTLTNLAAITTNLREPKGALGDWLIPTNVNRQIETVLGSANTALGSAKTAIGSANTTINTANTNLVAVAASLKLSLDNVASITSNLNAQVQANSLMLTEISTLVIHADEMLQGLKRHWLLKGSFPGETNAPIKSIVVPSR